MLWTIQVTNFLLDFLVTSDNSSSVVDNTMFKLVPMLINLFFYFPISIGEGPAVWFMVGKEDEPYNEEFAELTGTIIPDENGRYLSHKNTRQDTIPYGS